MTEFTTPWLDLVGGRDPHQGAKRLWAELVSPESVPGYSKVRWWSKVEIWFVMARNFHQLSPFIRLLQQRDIVDVTTRKMLTILRERGAQLQRELAVMLDMQPIVKTTYELEGDRLEILLVYRRIEALRRLEAVLPNLDSLFCALTDSKLALRRYGRAIKAYQEGVLPNLDTVLRSQVKLEVGVGIKKQFPGMGAFKGKIFGSSMVDSTLYPGKERLAYSVRYDADGTVDEFEEEEIRPLICIDEMPHRKELCDAVAQAFDYMENRFTGNCDDVYDCSEMYEWCRVLQVFDPMYGRSHTSVNSIDDLAKVTPLVAHANLQDMKSELLKFLTLSQDVTVNYNDVDSFTQTTLSWWRNNASELPAWSAAAKAVFAITPNSASCERAFAALRNLFDEKQISSLSDQIESALLLNINGREIG